MSQRSGSTEPIKRPPVVDLTLQDMPTLSQPDRATPCRKPSLEATDSFDFSEIDKRMGRIGGKCFAPDATTDAHFKRDSRIRESETDTSSNFPDRGLEPPRAPITETVTWDDPPDSDNDGF